MKLFSRVAMLALAVVGVFGLAELTQNRPDEAVPGSSTTVEFTVSTRDYQRGDTAAATALWITCSATVSGDVSAVPEARGDAWHARIEPAIGEHGENRLVGCLEDVTLDRVIGDVVALRTSAP